VQGRLGRCGGGRGYWWWAVGGGGLRAWAGGSWARSGGQTAKMCDCVISVCVCMCEPVYVCVLSLKCVWLYVSALLLRVLWLPRGCFNGCSCFCLDTHSHTHVPNRMAQAHPANQHALAYEHLYMIYACSRPSLQPH